eukprot:COSAG05_NODE_1390_length_5002_cov_2.478075_1_plen_726_part_00
MLDGKHFDASALPPSLNSGTPVWVVRFTGEIFARYEDYVDRLMLYRQRVWTCEFTNASNMTFEEALMSELGATRHIDAFPQTHFKTLLEKTQFCTNRIEELVSNVHTYFTEHYMAGEELDALDGENIARVRILNEQRSDMGLADDEEGLEASSQYEVEWIGQTGRTTSLVDEEAIMRTSKAPVPSKVLIRNTIKAVSLKETYPNSPWIVRKEIAEEYEVSIDMPCELKRVREEYYRRRSAGPEPKRQKHDGETAQERKEREREERKLKREEDKRRKALEARYPIADEALEHSSPVQLPVGLSAHISIGNPHFGQALYVWTALNTFDRAWNLSPFSFEEFDQALRHDGRCVLRSEIFVAVLRVALTSSRKEALKQQGHSCRDTDASMLGEASVDLDHEQENWTVPVSWILNVDVTAVTAATDAWEDVLRQYLQYMTEISMVKRLELSEGREYAESVKDDAISFGGQPACEWLPNADGVLELTYDGEPAATGDLVSDTAHIDNKPATVERNTGHELKPYRNDGSVESLQTQEPGRMQESQEQNFTVEDSAAKSKLRHVLVRIVRGVLQSRDKNRLRAELFLELPDRQLYPDYYQLIAEPISVNMILGQAERGEFADHESFLDAWRLLHNNAHRYNPASSIVCQDADWFLKIVGRQLRQYETAQKLEKCEPAPGLAVPDISGVGLGALISGTANLKDTLNLLCFLADEALCTEPSREHISAVLEKVSL